MSDETPAPQFKPSTPSLHLAALQERVAEGERLLRKIIDAIPVAVTYLDEQLVYRQCNLAAAEEIGLPIEQIVGRHIRDVLQDNGEICDAAEGVLRTGAPFRQPEMPVLWPQRAGEGPHYYSVAYLPDVDESGRVRGVIAEGRQVTAAVRARQQLQEARDELEARVAERTAELTQANEDLRYQATILANVYDAVIATDANRRIRYLNPAAEKLSGWSSTEAQGHNPVHLFRAEFIDGTDEDFARAVETEGRWRGEVLIHTRDERTFYVDATAETLRDDDGRLIGHVGVYRDNTARRRLEEVLRTRHEQAQDFSRRLVTAVENERRTLARDLHDQAGQSLWALKLQLERLRRDIRPDDRQAERFAKIEQIVDGLGSELRRLATDMRPVLLDQSGLLPALGEYVDDFRSRSGILVSLDVPSIEARRLPTEVETALYRIVQEALTNVVRHAHAREVSISLQREDRRVTVRIADDGQGFDLAEAMRSGRMGLLGMRERAELLRGNLNVTSAPGQGTVLSVELPLGHD